MIKRFLLVAFLGLWPAWLWAETRYVQVESTRLLKKPSAFSSAMAVLKYQSPVEIIKPVRAYYLVKAANVVGFVPRSSLAVKKPVYAAKLSGSYLSQDEVAMATKGFNAQVEADYRQGNPQLNYTNIDRWEEQTRVPDPFKTFLDFRQLGHLGEFSARGGAE
jgi:hypothetical protein